MTMTAHANPVPLGLAPSFGFGDRLGLATPGHIAALRRAGGEIRPIFAQQSIREMARTGRSPQQVMQDAINATAQSGFAGQMGADADHLKTTEDVDRTAAAGFCFFTIDPSDFVDGQADSYDGDTLTQKVKALGDDAAWVLRYRGQTIPLSQGRTIEIDELTVARAAVKYGKAVNHALRLSEHMSRVFAGRESDYEIELSVDETPQPTTLAEHFIIADHCLRQGMKLISLAPRFIGDFEKGVDYKGDVAAFERSLEDHAALARSLGPYKLSLHSGSDKLSIYPAFARATKGLFHVKTAGTSYLEALRAVARHDVDLFRRFIDFARSRYEHDRATYHVSASLQAVPPPAKITDDIELERLYLERWDDVPAGQGFTAPGRQILHTTYGSVLTNPSLREPIMQILREHSHTYAQVLEEHFVRHLDALREGMLD